MATGDQHNVASRLRQLLPPSWFPDLAPNLWALLQGAGNVFAWLYALISFAKLQTRISTATGFFLDLMGLDFFGRNFPRMKGQSDASYSAAMKKELIRERVTRKG